MNVIFLDFDGVLNTINYSSNEDIKRRIKILSDICKEYDCKIVIEASIKDEIDEETLKTDIDWVNFIFDCFKEYGIDCIGRTPTVKKKISDNYCYQIWKEYEIRLYLFRHPEIKHYCIIDDDDLGPNNSDLNMVRDHLVKTIYYSNNKEEEGLLKEHKHKVKEILQLDNKIRKLVFKNKKI